MLNKIKLTLSLLSILTLSFISCNNETVNTNNTIENQETTAEVVPEKVQMNISEMNYQQASENMLRDLADGKDVNEYAEKFAAANLEQLAAEINTDDKKKAFWINLYNAYIQKLLIENPSLYDDRNDFFGEDRFIIAGKEISFDKVEHGIIRSSTMKLSGGFLGEIFVGGYEKKLRTDEVDPRIHFAVNCGAKDCPQIHILSPNTVNAELDEMTKNYLGKVAEYDAASNVAKTTSLMSWFRGDWGGKDGVVDFLKKYDIVPSTATDVELEFKDYDWTLNTGMFAEEV
jgi:hypothetical protein